MQKETFRPAALPGVNAMESNFTLPPENRITEHYDERNQGAEEQSRGAFFCRVNQVRNVPEVA